MSAERAVHRCHWPGCPLVVPPRMWGCKSHWFRLPKALRDRIWATYRPGQEISKTPSPAYIEAANAVQAWIAEHGCEHHWLSITFPVESERQRCTKCGRERRVETVYG